MHDQMLFFDQHTELLFQRIAACAGQFDHVANADAAMVADEVQNAK
jgi:hypothetical protein